jgi:lipid-binding SYLF domain-containing protein
MFAALVLPVSAVTQAELDQKAQVILGKFAALQEKPDKCIPAEVLRKAQGLILLDRTKAGFVFAYQGGGGVALVKDKKSGKWGPLAFVRANEASLGFQVGGQQSFIAIVLMTAESVSALMRDGTFEFGGEARGTAGNNSVVAEGKLNDPPVPYLVYDDRQGLFGGAAIKGGAMTPDSEANLVYYGSPLTMKEILFDKKAKPSASAEAFAKRIAEWGQKK